MRHPRGNDGKQAAAVVVAVHVGEKRVQVSHRSLALRGEAKERDKYRESGGGGGIEEGKEGGWGRGGGR